MSPLNVLDLGLLLRTAIPSDDKRLLTSSPLPPFLSRQKTYEQLFTLEGSYYGITSLVSPQDLIKRPSDVASGLGVFAQSVRGDKDFQAVIRKELRADPVLLDRRIFEKAAEHVQLSALSRRDQQLCLSHYLNYGFLSVYPPRTSKENISQQEATPDIEDLLKTLQPLHDLRLLVSDNMLLEGLSPQKIWPFVWALLIIQHQGTPALEDDPLFAGSIEKIAQAHEEEGLFYSARCHRIFAHLSQPGPSALPSIIEAYENLAKKARAVWDGWQRGDEDPIVLVENLPDLLSQFEELQTRLGNDFPFLRRVLEPIDVYPSATPFSPNSSLAYVPKFPAVAAMLLEREIKLRSDILNNDKKEYERKIKNLPPSDPLGRMVRAQQNPVWVEIFWMKSSVEGLIEKYSNKSEQEILRRCENIAQVVDDLKKNSEEDTIHERMISLFYTRLKIDVYILLLRASAPPSIDGARRKAAELFVHLSEELRQREATSTVTYTYASRSFGPVTASSLFEKARAQMAEGLWGEAERSFRTLISLSPTDPFAVWARFHVALIYQKCQCHEIAEPILRNLSRRYNNIPEFAAYHGLSLESQWEAAGEKSGARIEDIILVYIHSFERLQLSDSPLGEIDRVWEDSDPLDRLAQSTLKHLADQQREETLNFLKETLEYYRILLPDLNKYALLNELEEAASWIASSSQPSLFFNSYNLSTSTATLVTLLQQRRFTLALHRLQERCAQDTRDTGADPHKRTLDNAEIELFLKTAQSLFSQLNYTKNAADLRFIRDLGQFITALEKQTPHHFGINILLADIALSLENQDSARQRFGKALKVFPESLYLRRMSRL